MLNIVTIRFVIFGRRIYLTYLFNIIIVFYLMCIMGIFLWNFRRTEIFNVNYYWWWHFIVFLLITRTNPFLNTRNIIVFKLLYDILSFAAFILFILFSFTICLWFWYLLFIPIQNIMILLNYLFLKFGIFNYFYLHLRSW